MEAGWTMVGTEKALTADYYRGIKYVLHKQEGSGCRPRLFCCWNQFDAFLGYSVVPVMALILI